MATRVVQSNHEIDRVYTINLEVMRDGPVEVREVLDAIGSYNPDYIDYRTGGYYHHVSKKNATAPPNVVNTSDTQYLSLETCIIMIFTRWYGQHCTLTVASGHTLK